MNKIYTIGIIGAGMIAEQHIINLSKTNRAIIKAVADLSTERLLEIKEKYKIENSTLDYFDILKDKSIDAVIVCTPPHLHKKVFKDALKAGKHVLVEKPLAMNIEEIDEMIALSKQHPELIVMECSARHSRLQPKYRKIKEIIDSGALGEIYYVNHNSVSRQSRAGIEYHPTAKWFLDKEKSGGGPLFDWGIYDLSFHLGLLGDKLELKNILNIKLKSGLDKVDPGTDIYNVEEHFMASLEFSDNIAYNWERAAHANMEVPNETRIYGTKGGLKFGYCSWDEPVIEFFNLDNEGRGKAQKQEIIVNMSGHDDSYALSDHFIHVLDGREKPALSLELARKHLEIIFNCYEQARIQKK